MTKVAFITPGAYPVPSTMGGSVERVVEKVVPLLLSSVDARIYGRKGGLPARSMLQNVPCIRFPVTDKERYFRRVCRQLAVDRPDVIQVENRPRWVPRLKKRFPRCRIWLNLHSTTFISRPFLAPNDRDRCLQAADRIVVNSRFLESYIVTRIPEVADKIRVNHLGVDADSFPGRETPEGMVLRERERWKRGWENRKIILYVGRLIPKKGVHHLLAALPAIVDASPDALVVIVGSAEYGARRKTAYVRKLQEMAKPWRRHVIFQPYVPHTEIPQWYAMADVAVVPSAGREAFGLVNVEAMAAGVPVVATSAGGMTEIVSDGLTGFLVPAEPPAVVSALADRIGRLLLNEPLRRAMGAAGRERVWLSFRWEHTADRWRQMLWEE